MKTRLSECTTLVNIEGEVYRLSDRKYKWFKDQIYKKHCSDNLLDWSDLLRWVKEHGRFICAVESYNF